MRQQSEETLKMSTFFCNFKENVNVHLNVFGKSSIFHLNKFIPPRSLVVHDFNRRIESSQIRHALPCKSHRKNSISIKMQPRLSYYHNHKSQKY